MTTTKVFTFALIISSICILSCKKDFSANKPEFKLEQADYLSQEEYEIYSLVINEIYTDTIVIQQNTNTDIEVSKDSYFYSFLSDSNPNIDSSLFDNYILQNDTSYCFSNNFNCPDLQIRLISTSELQYIFEGQDINNDWDKFYIDYPNSNGIINFTRIGFSKNHTQALFEIGRQYGSLGGEGQIVYLEKINNLWVIRNFVPTWIS
jgi:hypothetical protein